MASTQQKTLFLVGPGFIGGTLLAKLREKRPELVLLALTRREEQAKELQSMGVTPIMGQLHDAAIIKEHASKADIVVHTATADDKPSAMAIVDGIKSRADKKRKVVYIHTSGNDQLAGSAKQLAGQSVEARTLSDVQGDEALEKDRIQPDAYHRHVDGPLREQLINTAAEKEHNVSSTIMMPPLVYGISAGKRNSIQVPMLAQCMMEKGTIALDPSHSGQWNAVSVHDLAEAYIVLLQELEAHTPGTPQPSHYCFPAEPTPFVWKDVIDAVVEEIHARTKASAPAKILTSRKLFEDFVGGDQNPYAPCFGAIVWADDNSYTLPDRLSKHGFKHQGKGPIDSIKKGGELKAVLDKLELSTRK